MKSINLLSLFSGIVAFEKALDNLNVPYKLVGYCEIDKYASKSYSAIHGVSEEINYGDITKINEKELPKDIDLITYGFPCQDISLAGKQKGLFNEDGTQTRSGLFFEALRIIEETRPRVAIAENVKNLVGKKFKDQFEIVLNSLEEAWYNNYYKVLNSKDFGIPQNRERVFIVSIRKDVDTGTFEFPEGFPLELRLKDMLEDEVDEKFYLSNQGIKCLDAILKRSEERGLGFRSGIINRNDDNGICTCIDANYHKGCDGKRTMIEEEPIRLGNIYGEQFGTGYTGNVCDKESISPILMTMQGGNRQPMVVVKTNNSKGYDIAEPGDYINIERPGSTTRRGRVGHGVSQCLDTKENHCVVTQEQLRIRKLTPKECFRLQGFDDADFEKAKWTEDSFYLVGGIKKCSVKLKVVQEKQILTDSETYVSCTTKDLKSMEILKTIALSSARMQESENLVNVNIAIERLEEMEHLECATNITKCIDYMGMHFTMIQRKEQHLMDIIVKENMGSTNTGKCMKITMESNLPQNKLYTILTLIVQIIESKIFTSTIRQASISGCITLTTDYANNILLNVSNLKMECIRERTSNTELYKQAGNSITVDVLYHLFTQIIKSGVFESESDDSKVTDEKEGQMGFVDAESFERYIEAYKEESNGLR